MEDHFGIASFRSRQQVMGLERALRRVGVPASIITTPRAVALGCGLSVQFRLADLSDVVDVYRAERLGNLIGFYQVRRDGAGRISVTPLNTGA